MNTPNSSLILTSSCRKRIGRQIVNLPETNSTNTWLLENITQYTPEGLTVVAQRQLAGRGTHGNIWEAGKKRHLFCSIALKPTLAPAYLPTLSLIISVGIHRALTMLGVPTATLKWPNDLLVNGKKICGILCEARQYDEVRWVAVGFGLNIQGNSSQFSAEIAQKTTTLEEATGHQFKIHEVLDVSLSALDETYEELIKYNHKHVLKEWTEKSCTLGRKVIITSNPHKPDIQSVIYGTATGIDEYGGLVLQLDNNEKTIIYSGTLRYL